jgi:hypothetical protein
MKKCVYNFLGLVFLLGGLQAAEVNGVVVSAKGEVKIYQPGSLEAVPLTTGMTVPSGSKIVTGTGEVLVSPIPSTVIRLDPGTTAKVSDLEFEKTNTEITKRRASISLEKGSIYASLLRLDPRKTDFRIKTPRGVAAARGTTLRVWIDPGTGDVYVMNIPEGKGSQVGVQIKGTGAAPTVKEGETIILRVVNGVVEYVIRKTTTEESTKGTEFQNTSSSIIVTVNPNGTITLPSQLGNAGSNPSNLKEDTNP